MDREPGDDHSDRHVPLWEPLPGPQTAALQSPAFETLYGGSAGGGKSDLLLGLAATAHTQAIIFRRQYVQLSELERRSREILGGTGQYNGQRMEWRYARDGRARTLRFGAMAAPEDWEKFQGRAFDLLAFDELAHFTEDQYLKLHTWARSTDPAQRVRVVAASNPPGTAEGEWIVRRWAAWLDPTHPNPAASGEIRFFVTLPDGDTEVDSPASVVIDGRTYHPRSRTFIRARVEDNPYLLATGYREALEALPEPFRSLMLDGDFTAGLEDDAWQVIPTRWVLAAQGRAGAAALDRTVEQVGVDVARGGRDRTVLALRRGLTLDPLWRTPKPSGPDEEDGYYVAAQVLAALAREASPEALVVIDGIGVGASPYDILRRSEGVRVYSAIASEKATTVDQSGRQRFLNKRSAWWWHMRELLDPDNGYLVTLPPDAELRADLCAPRWKALANRVIQVESRDEIVRRLGRSPDAGTACVLAFAPLAAVDRSRTRAYTVNRTAVRQVQPPAR